MISGGIESRPLSAASPCRGATPCSVTGLSHTTSGARVAAAGGLSLTCYPPIQHGSPPLPHARPIGRGATPCSVQVPARRTSGARYADFFARSVSHVSWLIGRRALQSNWFAFPFVYLRVLGGKAMVGFGAAKKSTGADEVPSPLNPPYKSACCELFAVNCGLSHLLRQYGTPKALDRWATFSLLAVLS